jgi:hypothetical protein
MMIMEGKGGEYTGRVAKITEAGVRERERVSENYGICYIIVKTYAPTSNKMHYI